MKRMLLTTLLAGIAMFIWTSLAHMGLPLGEAGISEIPHESAVLAAMQDGIGGQPGLYLFPGTGLGPKATRAERHEAMSHMAERLPSHPSGLLMYFPTGSRPLMMVRWLLLEFGTELLEAFLVILLLSRTRLTSFGGRVGFVTLAGLLAAIATNVSYWNWYGFPGVYTVSYMFIQVVGFLCIGVVAALVLKNQKFAS